MPNPPPLSPQDREAILKYDTGQISNAIETFGVRLRNEGYALPGIRCQTKPDPRVLGYAVTCRVRTDGPPISGRAYPERTDWWSLIQTFPEPRIAVLQDTSAVPGSGAIAGETHSVILQALGCSALITNGAVRDVSSVSRLGFPLFAAGLCPSHSYFHLIDFGDPVEINGLAVAPGDLLYADCQGIVSIPPSLAPQLPSVAARLVAREHRIAEFCQSPGFSIEKLRQEIEGPV